MNANLFAWRWPALDRDPSRPALFWRGGPVTGGEILDRAAGIAARLRALGVGPGDRVSVQVEKSPENVALVSARSRPG